MMNVNDATHVHYSANSWACQQAFGGDPRPAKSVCDELGGDETACESPEGDCHVSLAMTVKGECNGRGRRPPKTTGYTSAQVVGVAQEFLL
jgi:hypothetical protein